MGRLLQLGGVVGCIGVGAISVHLQRPLFQEVLVMVQEEGLRQHNGLLGCYDVEQRKGKTLQHCSVVDREQVEYLRGWIVAGQRANGIWVEPRVVRR